MRDKKRALVLTKTLDLFFFSLRWHYPGQVIWVYSQVNKLFEPPREKDFKQYAAKTMPAGLKPDGDIIAFLLSLLTN